MTCCIFHIYLNITNNYITQYDVLKSDSWVDGWKIQKKDKFLAITFSGTDAAGKDYIGTHCKMSDLIFRPFYVRERVSGIGNWVSRRRRNWVSDSWPFLSFTYLCISLICENIKISTLLLLCLRRVDEFSLDKEQIVPNLCSSVPKSCNFKVFMCKYFLFIWVEQDENRRRQGIFSEEEGDIIRSKARETLLGRNY